MGWRRGRGVGRIDADGTAEALKGPEEEEEDNPAAHEADPASEVADIADPAEAAGALDAGPSRKRRKRAWGAHATTRAANVALYLPLAKTDLHGLG